VGPGVKTGIKLPTENPKEVGADLVSVAAGVVDKYGPHAIIIDMGTATTVSLVKNSALEGVSIMIGLDSAKEALIDKTALLPDFVYQLPQRPIGDTTLSALNAGFLYGHFYQIKGFVDALKEEIMNVIITGGAAIMIRSLFKDDYIYDPTIIHHGLAVIADKNSR
jgi:type III pantothenate kinase